MIIEFVCGLILITVAVIVILTAYRVSIAKIDCYTEIIESIPIAPYTFTIGERIRRRGNTCDNIGHYIVDIREGYYWCDDGITIPHSQQHLFEKFNK